LLLSAAERGTPLEIALHPVSAVQPDENAATQEQQRELVRWPSLGGDASRRLGATRSCAEEVRTSPVTIITRVTTTMNAYVWDGERRARLAHAAQVRRAAASHERRRAQTRSG
jgi:hypothetical protein